MLKSGDLGLEMMTSITAIANCDEDIDNIDGNDDANLDKNHVDNIEDLVHAQAKLCHRRFEHFSHPGHHYHFSFYDYHVDCVGMVVIKDIILMIVNVQMIMIMMKMI